MYSLSGISYDSEWFQSLPDRSCGEWNCDPSYQVERQMKLFSLDSLEIMGRWLFKSVAHIHSCVSSSQIFGNFQEKKHKGLMDGTCISSSKENSIDLTQITLRRFRHSDIDDLMVWETDEKVAKLGWGTPYTSKDEGISFLENIPTTFKLCRAICLNGRAIGSIMINKPHDERRKKSAELRYVLGSEYWGKGITTCAVKRVVNVVFTQLSRLERLEALVDVENVGAQRVLEKAGFQKEGILRKYWSEKGKSRDVIMFSLLSTDLHQ